MDLWKNVKNIIGFTSDTMKKMNNKHQEKIEKMEQKRDEELLDIIKTKTGNQANYAANELRNRGYSESRIEKMMKRNEK